MVKYTTLVNVYKNVIDGYLRRDVYIISACQNEFKWAIMFWLKQSLET